MTAEGVRDEKFCGSPKPFCTSNDDCEFGCICQGDECVPPSAEPDPDFCRHGYTPCSSQNDCPLGCDCRGNRCWPGNNEIPYYYCAGQEQDLMCRGPSYTVFDEESLAGAIVMANASDHPFGIIFDPPGGEIIISSDLPPLTSLMYLDGAHPQRASPVILRGKGARVGLTVKGKAVVLHDLVLVGFPEAAVLIKGESSDVHLYRMRIGEYQEPNGHGISIESGAKNIYIGRGREIGQGHCVGWEISPPVSACNAQGYDVNVIVSNQGDGIRAVGVTNLLVEGTWVGFDTVGDCDSGGGARPDLANQGTGIRLENVTQAYLGMRNIAEEELSEGKDLLPGCVAVGRSAQGGVLVRGGGNVFMRCLLLGDTPLMVPYYENQQFGLAIEQNTLPVNFGAPPIARDFAANSLNLVHVLTTPAIKVNNNQAAVWLRGAQLQSLGTDVTRRPAHIIEVNDAAAAVSMVHLSVFGNATEAAIFASSQWGVKISLVNSYLRSFEATSIPVINSPSNSTGIELHHNMKVRFAEWCAGSCPDVSNIDTLYQADSEGGGWQSPGAVPIEPWCQVVDKAKAMDLDVNGLVPGLHSGCCPDLGAWECVSKSCREIESSCPNTDCL